MHPTPTTPKAGKPRLILALLAAVLAGGLVACSKSTRKEAAPREQIVTITLPPPPPPPPPPKVEPPPPEEKPPEQEMVMQEPVPDNEPPPEAAPPESPPEEALGTGIAGNGPDMGLSGKGNGGGTRIGGGGRNGGGSQWGYYAAKVQATLATALRGNPQTRSASFSVQVRIWAGPDGSITRVSLVGTTGDPAVDRAIQDQALAGLRLPSPPPEGMPMPITLRLTARKP